MVASDVDELKPKEVRDKAPFQAKDVVWVEHDKTAKKAVVLCVFSKYLTFRGYYLPRYRIAFITDDGKWSDKWQYAFPGNIFRGYKNMNAIPADCLEE